jgi:hypothetical protein
MERKNLKLTENAEMNGFVEWWHANVEQKRRMDSDVLAAMWWCAKTVRSDKKIGCAIQSIHGEVQVYRDSDGDGGCGDYEMEKSERPTDYSIIMFGGMKGEPEVSNEALVQRMNALATEKKSFSYGFSGFGVPTFELEKESRKYLALLMLSNFKDITPNIHGSVLFMTAMTEEVKGMFDRFTSNTKPEEPVSSMVWECMDGVERNEKRKLGISPRKIKVK